MTKIYINGKEFEVNKDKNLLEVCLGLGFNIPYFCYHPALCSVGACRLCAVKIYNNEHDTKGRIIMSCMEPVQEGMRIFTDDSEVLDFRAHVIESLMTNHPHDCPICDEGGECHLQDMTVMTGHTYRRYEFKKRTYRNQNLGPFINHEMNRCIQCYRCVRYYKDYAGGRDLDVFGARNELYFGRYDDGRLESEFSGNLVEVCPTGVFTDKTLKKHYTRKWDMTNSPSVCPLCSLGCNIFISERYGSLRRVLNRYNSEVNGYFLCDRGRFGYEFVNSEKRIKNIIFRNEELQSYETITKAQLFNILKPILQSANEQRTTIIGIGSATASLESNYVLKQLVGKDNFYTGYYPKKHYLIKQVLDIIAASPAKIPSLKDIEKCDAVLILGEDITNTAPIAALAVRQAVRQRPMLKADALKIPRWNDQAVRNLTQDENGPLFIATPFETKLDDIANDTYRAAPEDIARFGFAIANLLNNESPDVEDLSRDILLKAKAVADSLRTASNPLIISGTFSQNIDIINSASNIATALISTLAHEHMSTSVNLFYILPDCNSLGLLMLNGKKVESLLDNSENNKVDCVIIIENDFYKYGCNDKVTNLLLESKNIITLNHTENSTTLRSDLIIPVTTFAESNGTFVNNEGRAQRFYSVFPTEQFSDSILPTPHSNLIKESWKWLKELIDISGKKPEHDFSSLEELREVISKTIPAFKEILAHEHISSLAHENKIPRQTLRFSGRTAINAEINVSEPKPPADNETPLGFTMEGCTLPPTPPQLGRGEGWGSLNPFYWTPGWNSVQSLNKYQREIGGLLYNENPGINIIKSITLAHEHMSTSAHYFTFIPSAFKPKDNELLILEITNIFGSDFLSSLSPSIAEAIPDSFILLNVLDSNKFSILENEIINVTVNNNTYRASAKVRIDIPEGVAGLFANVTKYGKIEFPDWGKISKITKKV